MISRLRNLGVVAVASLLFAGIVNASTINTVSPFTGDWQPIGEPNTATYGQTFTVGAENTLTSFSLWLDGYVPAPVDFGAYIYKWDGSKATGPALFASGPQQFLGSPFGPPQEFSFLTGGLGLESGSQYVAFLSASNFFDGVWSTALMPYAGQFGSDAYAGGNFVFYNNGSDFLALTTHPWNKTGGVDDVWFSASLSSQSAPVPEPATVVLLASGLLGLAVSCRCRKKT